RQHEVNERSLQRRPLAEQNAEPAARDARRRLEVHDAELLAQRLVRERPEIEPPLPAPLADDNVRLLAALGRVRVRDVGHSQQSVGLLRLDGPDLLVERGDLVADAANALLRAVRVAAILEELAD